MNSLAKEFLLDPEYIYLNHGSFGATPRKVFERYQGLQRELESQPVAFLDRQFQSRMDDARRCLAEFLNTNPDRLVYVSNATTAVNIVARNLPLGPGDEVLSTDHEYGAMDRTWQFLASRQGFKYVRQPISIPIPNSSHILDQFWEGVTSNTRVIFLSHITSPTALIFPIKEICTEAKARGILTVIDGAHAPGQIPVDLADLDADFYAGNLHKWLCAPKGAGFLYAHPDHHACLDPLIVSWGWKSEKPGPSLLIDHHEWQGTRDPAAWLAVPEAIQFQDTYHWDTIRQSCHKLAVETQARLVEFTGEPAIVNPDLFAQMVSSKLPAVDTQDLHHYLYEQCQIEVPVFNWNGFPLLRVSIQAYNSCLHIDHLMDTLLKYYNDL